MTRRARVLDLDADLAGLAQVGLFVDYEDRFEAKDLGGYQWDGERRCWRFPSSRRAECQRLANELNRRNGYPVTAAEEEAAASRARRPPPTVNGRPPTDLAAAIVGMFRLLPPACRRPALAGLRRALHPDTGGDTAAMQALNTATKDLDL